MATKISGILAAAVLLFAGAAAAEDTQMGSGQASGWGRLPGNADCSVMKQRVASVRGIPAPQPDAMSSTPTPNNSGETRRTVLARRESAAGDSACEKGDLAAARRHYQRAIDQLTAPH